MIGTVGATGPRVERDHVLAGEVHERRAIVGLAKPEEGRMAEAAVAGPFAEADLSHQPWLDPGGAACGRRVVGEGRVGPAQRRESLRQIAQRLAVEARPDLAGVAQPAALE